MFNNLNTGLKNLRKPSRSRFQQAQSAQPESADSESVGDENQQPGQNNHGSGNNSTSNRVMSNGRGFCGGGSRVPAPTGRFAPASMFQQSQLQQHPAAFDDYMDMMDLGDEDGLAGMIDIDDLMKMNHVMMVSGGHGSGSSSMHYGGGPRGARDRHGNEKHVDRVVHTDFFIKFDDLLDPDDLD